MAGDRRYQFRPQPAWFRNMGSHSKGADTKTRKENTQRQMDFDHAG
jgi:hypothetical protein